MHRKYLPHQPCAHGAPAAMHLDCAECRTRVCHECLARRPYSQVRPYDAPHHAGVCTSCQPSTDGLQALLP